jgi:hypothetical protein
MKLKMEILCKIKEFNNKIYGANKAVQQALILVILP